MDSTLKNIIIISDVAYISGGAGKVAIETAIGLKNKGLNVFFFAGINKTDEELLKHGIKVTCVGVEHVTRQKGLLGKLSNIWNYRVARELDKYLLDFDNENTVVHVHSWTKALSASIFQVLKRRNFKTLISLHEFFTVCPNGGLYDYKQNKICTYDALSVKCLCCNCDKRNYLNKVFRLIRWSVQRFLLNRLKPSVIYISEFSKTIISKKVSFAINNSYLISNFVNFAVSDRVLCEKNQKAVYLGRVDQEKGVDLFCNAVTECNVEACVIGDGSWIEKLKSEYPDIQFVGWKNQDGIRAELANARYLIIPSKWYETMGLIAIEVKAYGIPIIVSAQCAASEYVNNDGLLFDVNSSDSLCKCIERMRDDKVVETFSKNAYSKFQRDKFSLGYHLSVLINAYNKELEDKNTYVR